MSMRLLHPRSRQMTGSKTVMTKQSSCKQRVEANINCEYREAGSVRIRLAMHLGRSFSPLVVCISSSAFCAIRQLILPNYRSGRK
jgi:hypothetical protein